MKAVPSVLAVVLSLFVQPLHATSRTGDMYSIPADLTDQGGGRTTDGAIYTNDASVGGIVGTAEVSAPPATIAQGFIGQIFEDSLYNNTPTFSGYTLSTPYQTAAAISLGKLLAKAADADGDSFAITAAGPSSTQDGVVQLQASSILYTPPGGYSGSDSFSLTITDSRGASVIGTVTLTVQPDTGIGPNPPVLTLLAGGHIGLAFRGIPGRSYEIQRSTDLTTWETLATLPAGPTGALSFVDSDPPQPNGYYRLRKP